jgi:menaquinone-dependent protoporphyrinogen oxidase
MKVLVTAASRYGATAEIARAIATVLYERGLDVAVIAPQHVDDLEPYDAVVLGSAVYTGHWLGPAKSLAQRAAGSLATRPLWLFSSGPVGDPSRKLVQQMDVDPVELPEILQATHAREHRRFPGKLDRRNLGLAQRTALAVFRGLEGDFRDFGQIRTWASHIADELQPSTGTAPATGLSAL